ncbi:Rid family hydrolase [Sphingomonas profundi]|uniref:Rid family hydrolase n=1 Tax=Alterirhizorhabdus profundi TaxID=2681549 RepID=UPI0018D1D1BA|nr:Rid family hydrolase [Sphingomonas profundi]
MEWALGAGQVGRFDVARIKLTALSREADLTRLEFGESALTFSGVGRSDLFGILQPIWEKEFDMRHARPVFECEERALYDAFQFSPAVRAGSFIYISGVIGADEKGRAFPDAEAEYHATFRTIAALLACEGATTADIVALDSFHVSGDLVADLHIFNAVRAGYMGVPHPAWTAIGVARLGITGARAEVRATAYLGKETVD